MIVLGIILLLIGYFTSLSILYTIGGILVVVGVVLWTSEQWGARWVAEKSGSSAASRRVRLPPGRPGAMVNFRCPETPCSGVSGHRLRPRPTEVGRAGLEPTNTIAAQRV